MSINLNGTDVWFIATNGDTILTTPQKLETNYFMSTGQPNIVTSGNIDELIAKCFETPEKSKNQDIDGDQIGGYCMEELNKKTRDQIIANAD